MQTALAPVDALSDDDAGIAPAQGASSSMVACPQPIVRETVVVTPQSVHRIVMSNTCCKKHCFKNFRDSDGMSYVFKTAKHYHSLSKMEQDKFVRTQDYCSCGVVILVGCPDQDSTSFFLFTCFSLFKSACAYFFGLEVFDMIKTSHASQSDVAAVNSNKKVHMKLLGRPLCGKAFRKVFHLGNHRFHWICKSVREGSITCPMDLRSVPTRLTRVKGPKRATVFDFLQGLWNTTAEKLPDSSNNRKRPRHRHEPQPCYHADSEAKQLPPGSFMDYFKMFQRKHPECSVSYKFFTGCWARDFGDRLRVRKDSKHVKCATCTRHKLILKKIGHENQRARKQQMACYLRHLDRQYADRLQYWRHRSDARLTAKNPGHQGGTISLICDSMDAAKHCFPRSNAMNSKELGCWVRPKLSSTTLICHGFFINTYLSPPFLASNSSRSIEILGHGLNQLSSMCDLRSKHLKVQGDNCAKEMKSNGVLRFCALQVASHRVASAELGYLCSGHSHEDIDGLFSQMAQYIGKFPELPTMEDFRKCIDDFLAQPHCRVHEPIKQAWLLDQVRDWKLNCNMFFALLHRNKAFNSIAISMFLLHTLIN